MGHPALDGFVLDQQRRGLTRTTIRKRNTILWAFRAWLPHGELLKAEAEDVQTWLDGKDLRPRSRYAFVSHLHSFFDYAVRAGWREDDPTELIVRPKLPRNLPRPISERDLDLALREATPEMKAILALGAFQGFRAQETAGLAREDILEHEDPPLLIVSHGKNAKERVLPLNRFVERCLRQHGLPRSGWVFRSSRGGPYVPNTITHKVGRYFTELGITSTYHATRHRFATKLYQETNDIRLVQEMMGHTSPAVTAIYAQWSPKKAAEVLREWDVGPPIAEGSISEETDPS